jgi:hypothetical protein
LYNPNEHEGLQGANSNSNTSFIRDSRSSSIPNYKIIKEANLLERNISRSKFNKNQVGKKGLKNRHSHLNKLGLKSSGVADKSVESFKTYSGM